MLSTVPDKINISSIAVAVIIIMMIVLVPEKLLAQAPSLQATFDWSIPDRFGLDADNNGLTDYFTTTDAISPATWTVNVDACASHDGEHGAINNFNWSVPDLPPVDTFSCTAALSFPQQGEYDLTLSIITEQGEAASTTQTITVKDWLIVSLGDSYASGEGAPDRSASLFNPSATWQNEEHHRSAFAGPAVAARQLEESDPKSSVTFVHLARSGTRIIHEDPTETELFISAQITEALSLVGAREIDALLLSVGGNDVGFARLVSTCMAIEPCNEPEFMQEEEGLGTLICDKVLETFGALPGADALCAQGGEIAEEEIGEFTENWTKSAATLFEELAAPLPGRYDQLAADLAALNVTEGGIYITEYANPTRQDSGELCPQVDGANELPGVSGAEYQWVDEEMLVQLNGFMQQAADRNGWNYIGGIADGFATHGYCANDNWIVRLTQSIRAQVDLFGTMHPNAAGYAFTGDVIATQLEADLFNSGTTLYMPFAIQLEADLPSTETTLYMPTVFR